MKNFVKLVLLSALVFNVNIVIGYDLADVFKEAATAYEDATTSAEKSSIVPVMIASYGGLTAERSAEADVDNLADHDDANVKAQLDIVAPKNRSAEISARVAKLKTTYATVLAK